MCDASSWFSDRHVNFYYYILTIEINNSNDENPKWKWPAFVQSFWNPGVNILVFHGWNFINANLCRVETDFVGFVPQNWYYIMLKWVHSLPLASTAFTFSLSNYRNSSRQKLQKPLIFFGVNPQNWRFWTFVPHKENQFY